MHNERMDKIENLTKTSLNEVNTFLHTIHSDFEQFLNKHKKEHTNLNMRVLKATDDMSSLVTQFTSTKTAVEQYATVLTCLVEFNSIEQALATQDEEDRDQMQLMGKSKRPKMPDLNFTPDTSVFNTARHNDSLSLSSTRHDNRATDRMRRTGPIKGLSLGSHTSSTRQRNMLTTANFRSVNEHDEKGDMLKGYSTASGDDFKNLIPGQVGSVKLDDKFLTCTGAPTHAMQLFKMACISYNPSPVNYRQHILNRKKLLSMRRTLVDKCEEIINNNAWPHGAQDLRTGKIFRDLMQFYGTFDQSLHSEGSGMNDATMPS